MREKEERGVKKNSRRGAGVEPVAGEECRAYSNWTMQIRQVGGGQPKV